MRIRTKITFMGIFLPLAPVLIVLALVTIERQGLSLKMNATGGFGAKSAAGACADADKRGDASWGHEWGDASRRFARPCGLHP